MLDTLLALLALLAAPNRCRGIIAAWRVLL